MKYFARTIHLIAYIAVIGAMMGSTLITLCWSMQTGWEALCLPRISGWWLLLTAPVTITAGIDLVCWITINALTALYKVLPSACFPEDARNPDLIWLKRPVCIWSVLYHNTKQDGWQSSAVLHTEI